MNNISQLMLVCIICMHTIAYAYNDNMISSKDNALQIGATYGDEAISYQLSYGNEDIESTYGYGNEDIESTYGYGDEDIDFTNYSIKKKRSLQWVNPFNGKYSFGAGIGYSFDYINGMNNKISIILTSQWVKERFIFEVPFLVSYVTPNDTYFLNYFNNSGDGLSIDISILLGWYIIKSRNLGISLKTGIGYNLTYMFAMRERIINTSLGKEKDFAYAMYNALALKIGTEILYRDHGTGLLLSYYLPQYEELSLIPDKISEPTSQNVAFDSPVYVNSRNKLWNSFGLHVFYIYRF